MRDGAETCIVQCENGIEVRRGDREGRLVCVRYSTVTYKNSTEAARIQRSAGAERSVKAVRR